MIGQRNLRAKIDEFVDDGDVPNFIMIVGPRGSGKKTLVADKFYGVYLKDIKVESVREMVQSVYKMKNTTFIMTDCDNMSVAAKNALLKVVEECPNNNKFIMTVTDEQTMPDTIRSRAQIFHMDMYTREELSEYYVQFVESAGFRYSYEERIIAIDLCETPGEIQMLTQFGIQEFYDYAKQVVEHIAFVSGANSFKIANKVSLKDGEDGYDLKLFLTAFIRICLNMTLRQDVDVMKYAKAVSITSSYIRKLGLRSINKRGVMDMWILDIRKAWA